MKKIKPRRKTKTELIISPFGLNDANKELKILSDLYLRETTFTKLATSKYVSIIIGRRGSGKTALANFLKIHPEKPYDIYIDIDEPQTYMHFMEEIIKTNSTNKSIEIIEDIANLWKFSIWTTIFSELFSTETFKDNFNHQHIKTFLGNQGVIHNKSSSIIRDVLDSTSKMIDDKINTIYKLILKVGEHLNSNLFEMAKNEALAFFNDGYSAVIVVDTLDQYKIREYNMQLAIAAMLQAVTDFAAGGIHQYVEVKCFLPAEIVPHIDETSIANIGKTYERSLYLHWRPKDLLRLICWRFSYYLNSTQSSDKIDIEKIVWDDYDFVLKNIWYKFFPEKVMNFLGMEEDSFSYIIRHTQFRPRQLIWLCNNIAQRAYENKTFPQMTKEDIITGVVTRERDLAREVINALRNVYPAISHIISCFRDQDNIFKESFLDEIAPRTKKSWLPDFPYDRNIFREIVTELGLVGRVVNETELYYEAEFEYTIPDRLTFSESDRCALHPMFYHYFNINPDNKKLVYPVFKDWHNEYLI